MSIKGRSTFGRLEDHDTNHDTRPFKYATLSEVGSDKVALDVFNKGAFRVGAIPRTAAVGSTDSILTLVGHDMKRGDLIRFITTVNPIQEYEISVKEVLSVDDVELDGTLSHDITAGDTFEILRPVTERMTADGASIASVTSGPVSFKLNGATVEVSEDSLLPGNDVPLPVKLMGVTGDVNITAGDLNVQLSDVGLNADVTKIGNGTGNYLAIDNTSQAQVKMVHDTVNPSSVRIGDGTRLVAVDTSNQFKVKIAHDDLLNPSSIQIGEGLDILGINANKQALVFTQHDTGAGSSVKIGDGNDIMLIDGVGQASVKTIADTVNGSSIAIGDSITGAKATVDPSLQLKVKVAHDDATNPSSIQIGEGVDILGINANKQALVFTQHDTGAASSIKIGDGNDIMLIDGVGQASVKVIADTVNGSSIALADATTGVKAGVTATGELKVSASISDMDVLGFVRIDMSVTNITTAAYTQLFATVGAAAVKAIQVFSSTGTPILLALGAAASEVDKCLLPPGALPGHILPVKMAIGARLSAKAVGANITAGQLIINLLG